MLREPCAPLRPPASLDLLRRGERLLGIVREGIEHPVAAALLVRRVDDAGDVPARAEDERLFPAEQGQAAVRRAPRDDVVLARRDDEQRLVDPAEIPLLPELVL